MNCKNNESHHPLQKSIGVDGRVVDWNSTFKARGQFHKAKRPKFLFQNAKIFMAFSMFNFIKALTPKFSKNIAKNDGVLKVQFHKTNLALKTPKWAT